MNPSSGEVIELETPSPSPTHIWQDDHISLWEEIQTPGDYQVLSPQKRPRTYSARSQKLKKGRHAPYDSSQVHAIDAGSIDATQVDGSEASPDHDMASTYPTSSCTSHQEDGSLECPQGYHEYVESVITDIAGVYLLNPTLFIVQGWDSRTLAATVSYGRRIRWTLFNAFFTGFMVPFTTRDIQPSNRRRLLLSQRKK